MANILPRDLTAIPGGTVNPSAALIVDNLDGVFKATAANLVDAGAPINSQAEAEAGAVNTGRMSPLRVKQAIDALGVSQEVLAASTGSASVGFIQSGTGASLRTIESRLRDTVSVKDFGAVGDNSTDDTAAIQAAIDALVALGGGTLLFPKGIYKLTDTIVVERDTDNIGIIFQGYGRDSVIQQTGSAKNGILWSQTRFLFNSGMRDLKIACDATAGHCIVFGYGISTNFFHNVELTQANTGKSLFYGDFSSGGGVYDTHFRGGSWYCASGASVAGFRIICGGTFFNENIFENLRCYYASGEQFFKITAESGSSYWLVNNRWQNINFEIGVGGGFYLACMRIASIKNISFWDAGGDYTGNLVEFASGSGYESTANTMECVGRHGGALAVGVNDIKISSGQDTTILNCYTQTSDAPVYDFGGKRVTVTGRFVGTFNNDSGTRYIGTGSGAFKFPGCTAYLNYYDEGTWTATVGGSGANPTTPVTVTGQWTRIGRQVTVSAEFANVDTTGASGNVVITGLPFTVNTTYKGFGLVPTQGLGSAAFARATGTTISLYQLAAANTTVAHSAGSGAGAGKYIDISLTYIV